MGLITMSYKMGSGGSRIGKLVAEGLNLDLYDDKKLQEEARTMGLRSEELKGFDEKAPGFFDRILDRKPEAYLDLMEAVVYEVAQRGQGVIIGHGSQWLLRDFGCALHVFIHASAPVRLQNVMEQEGVSHDVAERLIRKSDNKQRGFFRFAFQMDRDDPGLYDLILNTEKLSRDSAVKLIMEAANSDEINTCSLTATDSMEKLSQLKKVEAALLKANANLSMLHVEVPEKGKVDIRGLVSTEDQRDEILNAIKDVRDIVDVRSDMVVRSIGY